MALNDRCKHNVSEDDCYKCMKLGIIVRCPVGCKDFEDNMTEKQKEFLKKYYGDLTD